jgi:hypothetical protein
MVPPSITPGGLIIRMIAQAVVDLPLPDSPTSPNRSPRIKEKSMLSTAFTGPDGVW